jgi:dipeptidyl-peptidase 4
MKQCILILLTLGLFATVAGAATVNDTVTQPNWDLAEQWSIMKVYNAVKSVEVYPHWLPDCDRFWYRYRTTEGRFYWLVDPESQSRVPLFDHQALAGQISSLAEQSGRDPVTATELDLSDVSFNDDRTAFTFVTGPATCNWDLAAGELSLVSVDTTEASPVPWLNLSPDEKYSVHARGNDLYLVEAASLEADVEHTRLTHDGIEGYAWGPDYALIDDSDIELRAVDAVWSPNSKRFALLRQDSRGVADLWLVDHLAEPRPELKTFKVPPAGGAVPQWELWLGDVSDGSLIQVPSARWKDQTLEDLFAATVLWSDDSQRLYFSRRSRDYKSVDLCCYDVAVQAVNVRIEERIDGMVYQLPPILLPGNDGDDILWWSMRSGWGHFYRYGTDGAIKTQLTNGDWNVAEVTSVDHDRGVFYFMGIGREKGRNPYYRHLYRVGFDGDDLQLLSPDDAEHLLSLAPSNAYFVDTTTRVDQTPKSVLRDNLGRHIMDLETADVSLLIDAGWQAPETFVAMSADGVTEQWGVMYKPFDFDSSRKYPIVTRVYPGRQGEAIPRRFWPVNMETMLANLGCIVVKFGNRGGTPERGLAYREYGRDDFRGYGLADKRAVIEELGARHEYIDLDRVGMFGSSSGGFMTVSAMLVDADFYKVGVAMSGPNEPQLYFNHWFERYKGLMPVAPADGNIELADQLQGKLLMIYGAQDDNVHPLHLMRQADAFIKAGKRFDMFMVPGADHGLGSWRYLYGMVLDYFAEHLIGTGRSSADILIQD